MDLGSNLLRCVWWTWTKTEEDMEVVNRILRYLKMTPGRGLLYEKNDSRKVEIYTDVDWARDVSDRRSTSGYCSYVWGNLVTEKQETVSSLKEQCKIRIQSPSTWNL